MVMKWLGHVVALQFQRHCIPLERVLIISKIICIKRLRLLPISILRLRLYCPHQGIFETDVGDPDPGLGLVQDLQPFFIFETNLIRFLGGGGGGALPGDSPKKLKQEKVSRRPSLGVFFFLLETLSRNSQPRIL